MGDIDRVVPANVILGKDGFEAKDNFSLGTEKIEGVRWHLGHRKRVK